MRCLASKTRSHRSHWYSYVGTDITPVEKRSTAPSALSKRRWSRWLLLGLVLTGLAGCAAGKEAEVRRLRARAVYDLALAHLREGRTSAGLASLQEAISLDPRRGVYQNTLGLVRLNLKNLPQAIEAFKKALELDPDYAEAQHNLGVALAESGQWEEAIKAYLKALTIPSNASPESVYTNMGWAYYNLGRLEEAESALRQALSLEPTLAAAHYNLGLVLLKAGRREEAKAAFRRTLELAPDSTFGVAAREHLKALGESQ
jgi:tetratricopeptide (TPR) repeat protein